MTSEQVMQDLCKVIDRACQAGYVFSGELCFNVPKTPGLVKSTAFVTFGQVNLLRIKTLPAEPPTSGAAVVVKPNPSLPVVLSDKVLEIPAPTVYKATSTLTGDTCIKCGSPRMVQAGACKVCLDCGESGGCG